MNKKFIIPTALGVTFVAGMAVVPNTYATDYNNITSWSGLKTCLEDSSQSLCKLGDDISDWSGDDTAEVAKVKDKHTVTLDLAGHELKATGQTSRIQVQQGGNMTITGGGSIANQQGSTDVSVAAILAVFGSNESGAPTKLVVDNGVTIHGITPINIPYSDGLDYTDITIKGTVLNDTAVANGGGDDAALNIFGTNVKPGIKVTVTETGVLKSTVGVGLFQAGMSDTTIKGRVEGLSGIAVKSGTINLNGATVVGNGPAKQGESKSSGFAPATGAAIQIDAAEEGVYAGDVKININDGSVLTSANNDTIQIYGEKSGAVKEIKTEGDVKLVAGAGHKIFTSTLTDFAGVTDANGEVIEFGNATIYPEPEKYPAHYPCQPFPACWFASTEPNDTPSDPTEPSEPTNPSNPSDPTNPGENNNGNANNGNIGSGDEGVVNPNTADPIAAYAGMVVVALLGLGATAAGMIKSRKTA